MTSTEVWVSTARGGRPSAVRSGTPLIGESNGERDIRAVVWGEVVAQLPDAVDEDVVLVPADGKVFEVLNSFGGTLRRGVTAADQPPEHAQDLQVDELRRIERVAVVCAVAAHRFAGGEIEQETGGGARVDDEHYRVSRSCRMMSAGAPTSAVASDADVRSSRAGQDRSNAS
jgi:hypothetical protein